jgi:gamma-glutamyltranspeptidase|tara:strand:+ start:145 stop:354 length:210 start_codon:yes stop_codon:yes gene_type:complete
MTDPDISQKILDHIEAQPPPPNKPVTANQTLTILKRKTTQQTSLRKAKKMKEIQESRQVAVNLATVLTS